MALDFQRFVASESARFGEVTAGADPTAPVAACPGWTLADLVWHLGGDVQWFWGTVVRERVQDPNPLVEPERPDGYPAVHRFFLDSSAALVDALANARDDEQVWTWFPADQSVGFLRRRQAHEALIHRLDAERAVGAATPIDADLATDGVAEVFDWMFSSYPAWAEHHLDGPVGRVRTSDTGGSWLVQLGRWSGTSPNSGTAYADKATLTVVHTGEPSFEVVGAAADLDVWLWNRPGGGAVELSGDSAAFEAVIREGVQ